MRFYRKSPWVVIHGEAEGASLCDLKPPLSRQSLLGTFIKFKIKRDEEEP